MTRARRITPGLGNPPLIQLWLEAVLCAFVRLVQGVATTFGMRFNRRTRDWHMGTAREALPQTKPDIQFKEPISESGQHVRIPGAGRDLASAHTVHFTGTRLSAPIPALNLALIPALILSVSKDAGMTGDGCNTSA
jgi:hypothetical protein